MKRLITTTLFAMLVMAGCSDFGNQNVDPNNAENPRTDLLLTEAQRSIGAYVGSVTGTLYVQYFSETQYVESQNYGTINFSFASGYTPTNSDPTINAYSGALQDLQTIIELNRSEETRTASYVTAGGSTANQIATARILKAYFFHTLTDRWGMVPFREALEGAENYTPAYATQQAIYASLIRELNEATEQLNPNEDGPVGDFIFEGDVARWEAFANTLRARMALRLTEVNSDSIDAAAQFADAQSDGLITQNVMYPYLSNQNNDNPWQDRFETRTDYAISLPMADTLKNLGDQRLTAFASPAPDSDDGDGTVEMSDIQGMPYGVSGDSAGSITNSSVSFPGAAIGYNNASAPLPVMTMAEVNFMLAEAAQRGWINTGTTPAQYYQDGIQASMEQWGVYDATEFASYISQPEVAYDPTEWQQQIGLQKWIALFPQGYEAWAEWRRLGYPALKPAPAATNDTGEIPVRQGYPTSESELNGENYQEAVSQQGEDALSTHLWWDRTE